MAEKKMSNGKVRIQFSVPAYMAEDLEEVCRYFRCSKTAYIEVALGREIAGDKQAIDARVFDSLPVGAGYVAEKN